MKKLILLMFIASLLPVAAIGQKKTADWKIYCGSFYPEKSCFQIWADDESAFAKGIEAEVFPEPDYRKEEFYMKSRVKSGIVPYNQYSLKGAQGIDQINILTMQGWELKDFEPDPITCGINSRIFRDFNAGIGQKGNRPRMYIAVKMAVDKEAQWSKIYAGRCKEAHKYIPSFFDDGWRSEEKFYYIKTSQIDVVKNLMMYGGWKFYSVLRLNLGIGTDTQTWLFYRDLDAPATLGK